MQTPEFDVVAAADVLVVSVFLRSLLEWECSSLQDEQDNTNGEQVNNLTLEGHSQVNLGCHVAHGTYEGLRFEAALARPINGVSKAEIGELQVVVFVEQKVLWLQIPVNNSLAVDVVNCLDELLGVELHSVGLEGARLLNHIEDAAMGCQLGHQTADFGLQAPGFAPSGSFNN